MPAKQQDTSGLTFVKAFSKQSVNVEQFHSPQVLCASSSGVHTQHRAQRLTQRPAVSQDALRAERIASVRAERQAQEAAEQAAAAAAQAARAGTWAWVGNRLVHTPAAGAAAHPAQPSGVGRVQPPGLDAPPGYQDPTGQHHFRQPGTAGPGLNRGPEQGVENGHEAAYGALDAHRPTRRRRRGGRRMRNAQNRLNGRPGSGEYDDDDDDEGSPHWDDGSSLHASEEFSEPGSATAELADVYTSSYFGAAPPLRRGSASGDGGERLTAQRHSGQLGEPQYGTGRAVSPAPADKSDIGLARVTDAADDEDVLGQLLGDLGVSEGDHQQAQRQSKPAQSLQRPSGAAVFQPNVGNAAHSRQQYVPQAATRPETAALAQPSAGWKAMLGIRPAQTAAPQPKAAEDSFVFRVGFQNAATGAAALPAFRPPRPAPTSGPQFGTAVPPLPPSQLQPRAAAPPSAPQNVRAVPQPEQVPGSGAPKGGRAAERGGGRRRAAMPQADALLLCPITQVGISASSAKLSQ